MYQINSRQPHNIQELGKNKEKNLKFKFLHASDIHLGYAQYQNENRSDDFLKAFTYILELSKHEKVDFLILGGDIFTSIDILPEKLLKIIKILEKFHKQTENSIPIISIEGNHDIRKYSRGFKTTRRQSWLRVLNHLGLIILLYIDVNKNQELTFPLYNFEIKRGAKIRIKNAMIYGTQYLGENPIKYIPLMLNSIERKKETFNILIQHFGIAGQMQNVPGISYKHLRNLKDRVDYLALGHYHLQYIINDWIFNPGSTEASCSIDTKYKRGAFIVEVYKNRIFYKNVRKIFIPNRNFFWQEITLPFTFTDKNRLIEYLLDELKAQFFIDDKKFNLNSQKPILYLKIRGLEPANSCKISKKHLKNILTKNLPIIDARIYFKLSKSIVTLDEYFSKVSIKKDRIKKVIF